MARIHTIDFWSGAEFDWRRVQAASDLKALLRPHEDALIAAMMAAGGPAQLVADRIGDFLARPNVTLDPGSGPFVRVWLEAALSAAAGPMSLPALAALLATVVLDLHNVEALSAHWERFHPSLITLPEPARAAYFNAFRELMLTANLQLDPALETDFCLSRLANEVCAPLQAIAAKATVSELVAISQADFGQGADRHLRRLIEVVETGSSAVPQTDSWYPLEVVQLVSHVPGKEGWLVSTAVVLVTAVRKNDCSGDGEFRWFRQNAIYRALDPGPRDAILEAIRHLYQDGVDFALTVCFDTVDSGPASLLPPEAGAVLPDQPVL